MRHSRVLLTALATLIAFGAYAEESRWEKAIQQFEKADAEKAPPQGAVLFIGSSSIRMWDTEKYFPDIATINRGFGGSQIADSLQFAHRIAIPYRPKVIAFYAGDNDLAAGKTPEVVSADYQEFVKKVHAKLPDTRIVFVAIKPSISRWNLVDKVRSANGLIREFSDQNDLLAFVDIDTPMIGGDGKPKQELFIADGLHLSAEGYELWTKLLNPFLKGAKEK